MTARTTTATTRVNATAVIGKGRMRRRNVPERPSELRAGYWLAGWLVANSCRREASSSSVSAQASLHLAGPPPEGHTTRCVRLRCRASEPALAAERRYTGGSEPPAGRLQRAGIGQRASAVQSQRTSRPWRVKAHKSPANGQGLVITPLLPLPAARSGRRLKVVQSRGNSRERESCSRGAVGPAPAAPNALPRRSRGTGRRNSPSPKKGGPARARSAAPQLARSTVGSSAGPCARLPARGARARCPPQAAARRLSGRSCAPYEGMTGAPPSSPRARRRTFSPLAV